MGKIAFKKTDRYKKPVDKCDTAHYNVFSFQALSHRNRGMKHVSNQKAWRSLSFYWSL